MQFEGFAGNAALKTALSAAFSRRRLPHTLLLQGEAGLGKRTLAQILARAAVCTCEDHDLAPCGVCPACIRAKAGSHPDIRIVTGSGKSNTISVASVDEVIRDAYKKPEEADINVYCIFAENPMPEITQNKLLKVIEEPPTGALFIFTVLSADALLPTIRSRAQVFTVRPPEESEAAVYVQNKTGMPMEEAEKLASLHRGNIGRMLSDGENGRAAKAEQMAEDIANALVSGTEHDLLAATAPLIKDKPLFPESMERLQLLLRDACLLKNNVNVQVPAREVCDKLRRKLSLKALMALCEMTAKYTEYWRRNANMALLVTALCAEMKETAGK